MARAGDDSVRADANGFDPRHPHEPDVAPVLDAEGRCLVCGCQWRDEQIAQRDAFIHELVKHLRTHKRECSLLPENTEDNPGWESEAHTPCTSQWHVIRRIKRAEFCPLCGADSASAPVDPLPPLIPRSPS